MNTTLLIILIAIIVFLALALYMMRRKYRQLKNFFEAGESTMNDRLQDAEEDKIRLKKQLTENVAHELKTPVSSIQGYLETIVSDPEMDEETKNHFIDRCYSQSKRLSALLQDISTLNKLDDAPQTYERTNVNVLNLLEGIKAEVAQRLEDRKCKFLILIGPDVVVEGNQSLMYSIFRNLTDNALAYAGEGITITVQTIGEDDKFYKFSFADNGAGVAPEHLPHLFERFYRVDKGRSRKLGGTGLGLAIVKNAVLLHHGKISVRLAQTGGLDFEFTLPKPESAPDHLPAGNQYSGNESQPSADASH